MKELELISNYSESKLGIPNIMVSYLHFENDSDRKKKMILRNEKISSLLDEEVIEDELDFFDHHYAISLENRITANVKTINLSGKTYLDDEEIWNRTLDKLNQLTSNSLIIHPSQIYSTREKSNQVIAKINYLLSKIAYESNTGIANTIICGLDAMELIISSPAFVYSSVYSSKKICGTLMSMRVILSERIDSNKIIVMRCSNNDIGLLTLKSDNFFYIGETESWEKVIKSITIY